MNRRTKRVVLSALTTIMAAASLTVGTASQASAINEVPCTRPDFVQMHLTISLSPGSSYYLCYANAGETSITSDPRKHFVDIIMSGNNRVQWHGDGRWQPGTPIEKWVTFTWPNHPGGVHIDKFKIH